MPGITGSTCRDDQLKAEANEWSITRGSRSGRVAWQFIQDLAGRLGKTLGLDPAIRLSRHPANALGRPPALGARRRGQELARVDRLLAAAQLEMELRLADPAAVADLGDDLTGADLCRPS